MLLLQFQSQCQLLPLPSNQLSLLQLRNQLLHLKKHQLLPRHQPKRQLKSTPKFLHQPQSSKSQDLHQNPPLPKHQHQRLYPLQFQSKRNPKPLPPKLKQSQLPSQPPKLKRNQSTESKQNLSQWQKKSTTIILLKKKSKHRNKLSMICKSRDSISVR